MNNTNELLSADSKLEDLQNFLSDKFDFRFNVLTEMPEYKAKDEKRFRMIDKRVMNTLCLEAMTNGIDCKDADVKRFIFSERIHTHHPFKDYLNALPEWDGTDRVTMLAARVSGQSFWINGFHRWMLGMVAQWLEFPSRCANSVAPLLVSIEQGMCKSTFCSMLLPEELQRFYTDKFEITSTSGCEQKLSTFGLINMDEFDRYTEKMMATLKNLMQMKRLNYRKCFRAYYSDLPRIASFIGTSNEKALLTDASGSRRFLCIEIKKPIDCSPMEHAQIYAQLKTELMQGKRYWFTKEEELEIQENNQDFYKQSTEEEVFLKIFRLPKEGETPMKLTATYIFDVLQKRFPALMRGANVRQFGKVLRHIGAKKIRSSQGSTYEVVYAKKPCKPACATDDTELKQAS